MSLALGLVVVQALFFDENTGGNEGAVECSPAASTSLYRVREIAQVFLGAVGIDVLRAVTGVVGSLGSKMTVGDDSSCSSEEWRGEADESSESDGC